MSTITPNTPLFGTANIYQSAPTDFGTYGMAQLDNGLVQIGQVNGYGLLTLGFVWQKGQYWFDPQSVLNLLTGWTAAAGYSGSATLIMTGWTAAAGYSGSATLIATTWTLSQTFGSEFPD